MRHLIHILLSLTLCMTACHHSADDTLQNNNPVIVITYSLPDYLDSTLIIDKGDIWRELKKMSEATGNDSLEVHLLNPDGQYSILATPAFIQITTESHEVAQAWSQKFYDLNYPFYTEHRDSCITFYVLSDTSNTQ